MSHDERLEKKRKGGPVGGEGGGGGGGGVHRRCWMGSVIGNGQRHMGA